MTGRHMRVSRYVLALILLTVAGCGSSRKVSAVPRVPIAIMDFEGRAGVDSGMAMIIRDAFASELQKTGRFTVVDRKMTAALIREQEFQASQQGQVGGTGKIHTIRKMLGGSIGKLGEDYVFNIKMTDIETSGVDFAISKIFNGDLEDIVEDFLPQLAQEVVQSMNK